MIEKLLRMITDTTYQTALIPLWQSHLIGSFVIVIATFIISRFILKYIFKQIIKLTKRTKTNWDDLIAKSLERPFNSLLIFTGLYLALITMPLNVGLINGITLVYKIIFIIIVAKAALGLDVLYSDMLLSISSKLNHRNAQIINLFFIKLIKFVIISLAIVLILDLFGFNVSTFVAGLGISGLAFALAAQDTLSNLISGVTLIFDKPFEVGDRIKTEGIDGFVEEISFRTTRLLTLNQEFVTIPNKNIANNPIVNLTRIDHLRNSITISCTYQTSSEKITALVERVRDMLIDLDGTVEDSIFVSFEGFGNSSLNVSAVFVTVTGTWAEFINVRQAANIEIMRIMEALEIDFAFPSQSVYFESPLVIEGKS